jgi:cobalt-zinc-cadmium resistance protein CzcA
VSPALSALLLPETVAHARPALYARLQPSMSGCAPSCCRAARSRRWRAGPRCGGGLAGSTIGLEFLPKLEEGNMWIRAVMPASISLEAGNDYANRMRS